MPENKTLPCICASCQETIHVAKSIMMEDFGVNSGCGSCPKCKTFLHIEVYPNLEGSQMVSQIHEKWLGRKQKERLANAN